MRGNDGKNKGASGVSRLFGAAKLQSASGADNSRYAAGCRILMGVAAKEFFEGPRKNWGRQLRDGMSCEFTW